MAGSDCDRTPCNPSRGRVHGEAAVRVWCTDCGFCRTLADAEETAPLADLSWAPTVLEAAEPDHGGLGDGP